MRNDREVRDATDGQIAARVCELITGDAERFEDEYETIKSEIRYRNQMNPAHAPSPTGRTVIAFRLSPHIIKGYNG